MIEFRDVSFAYAAGPGGQPRLAFEGADFTIHEGELVVVVGPTGSGKSTLLKCIPGLLPHTNAGTMRGRVVVDGRDTLQHVPRELAGVVGFVAQDPASSFVAATVEEELASGLDALGVDASVRQRRVEETLDLMGLAQVRQRPLRDLSGGQQQRVAIGAVLAAGPRVLVLDEPTSALDPIAAEDVLSTLHRLVHDLGITVVVAEHRLERVIHHADGVVVLEDGQVWPVKDPAEAMATSPVFPPVIGLGRALGWSPLPLSVRDARREARGLRQTLAAGPSPATSGKRHSAVGAAAGGAASSATASRATATSPAPVASLQGVSIRRGGTLALRDVDLVVRPGEVVAVMGRNGAGKSTLLNALVGRLPVATGRVRLGELDPLGAGAAAVSRCAGLVPQDPGRILEAESVDQQLASADHRPGLTVGTSGALLDRLAPGLPRDRHPRELSEGQRVCLALAVVLASAPALVLLDEPTRGLDYSTKRRLVGVLEDWARRGHAVLLATHDVELVADVATRVVVVAEGDVVTDGPAADVLTGSPAFGPQVAKVLHPRALLTVDEVVAALRATSGP